VLKGSLVALVTPFDDHNRVDYAALKRLIDFHVAEGTDGLVIAGTTGESATLATEEHIELIGRAVEISAGRLPIIAGTGSNSTAQTVNLSVAVRDTGLDGYLLVVPYYNKPCRRQAGDPLQRAGPHRGRPAARDRGAPREAREYRGDQGSNR
jgi:4-hydroxy-tetrahydrodipicolinate synthase